MILGKLESNGSGTDTDQGLEVDADADANVQESSDSDTSLIPFCTSSFAHNQATISIAKTPPLQSISISTIQGHFRAVNFLLCLIDFLHLCHQQFCLKYSIPTQHDIFKLYKQIVLDI
ncbi:hypothetical protein FRC02_006827 [Tulasnella sp. 418]|nr:hypothetical protein FRC02_006827 [Tulasnella sp. 418]